MNWVSKELNRYIKSGIKKVHGWLEQADIDYILEIVNYQNQSNIYGSVGEIGVHHGKLFILLNLLTREDEHSFAIDLFDEQKENIDRSGLGDLSIFKSNLDNYATNNQNIEILSMNSLDLDKNFYRETSSKKFKLFSIDGGHHYKAVINDLKIAEEVMVEGGVVLLDDLLNPLWIEVVSAYSSYKLKGGKLVAFAITKDKLYLTNSKKHAEGYQEALINVFNSKLNFLVKELFGDKVLTYYPRLLKNVINPENVKLFFKRPIVSLKFFISVIKRSTKEEKW
tara:strand:- start:227 stop:1069 length:843 start_codon:yes stop_codon:yes gene_type:complete